MQKIWGYKDNLTIEKYIRENILEITGKKGTLKIGEYEFTMYVMRVYLNSLLMQYFIDKLNVDIKCVPNLLYNKAGSASNVKKYIDRISIFLYKNGYAEATVREFMEYTIECMTRTQQFLENYYSYDISLLDILAITRKNKKYRKIIIEGGHVNQDMTPMEISQKQSEIFEELRGMIFEYKLEPFYTFLKSESCMRLPQFIACFGLIGASPLEDKVIPYEVDASWFRGISNIGEFITQAKTSRLAKILEKCKIDKTGVSLKDQMFVNKNVYIKDGDCGTKFLHRVLIKDEYDLKAHRGMFYAFENNPDGEFYRCHEKDTQLFGKYLWFRTPATCNYIDGHLCSKCVGVGTIDNIDIGLDAAMKIMGDAGQKYLSAKHITKLFAMFHINPKWFKYVKNTIRNRLKVFDTVKTIQFINPVINNHKVYANHIIINETEVIHIENAEVSTHIANLDSNDYVLDFDTIGIINKNMSSSGLYLALKVLLEGNNSSKGDVNIHRFIDNVYDACREEYHGVHIYTLIHKYLRDPESPFRRFDYSSMDKTMSDGTILSTKTLMGYGGINEMLPHGKRLLEMALLSPETYEGGRENTSNMDIILLPRRKEALEKMFNK